jgi:hypothetical protein
VIATRSLPLGKLNNPMRGIFCFLILASVSLFTQAQAPTTYGNFKVVDQEIIYQKVFVQDSVTAAKLAEFYKALPYVANVAVAGDEVSFDVNDITVDYKKFQFTQVATPPIIQTGKYSGKVTAAVKDGKYRLTFRTLMVTGNIGYKNITEKDRLTSYATKNSATILSPDWCKPNTLGLLDKAFTDKLQYTELQKKKDSDDW